MADNKKSKKKSGMISTSQTVAENRKARHEYHIEDRFEAGIMLAGTEVKSLRLGQCSLGESHVAFKHGDITLFNAHIPEYQQAGQHLQHNPRRPRKLLLHKREIKKLMGRVNREGYTIVPLKLYFNKTGLAKIEIALAKGKKAHDKREDVKQRDWNRQKQRLLKDKG